MTYPNMTQHDITPCSRSLGVTSSILQALFFVPDVREAALREQVNNPQYTLVVVLVHHAPAWLYVLARHADVAAYPSCIP